MRKTYYEQLMQREAPSLDMPAEDLYAWAYLHALKERVPFATQARTLWEAVGGVVEAVVLDTVEEEAWWWVEWWLWRHGRDEELRQAGVRARMRQAVARLWGE
jgi:hypothetical protein